MSNEMEWHSWRLNAERIASELLGVPVYIVLDDELPAGSELTGCWGCVWPALGAMLRDQRS